MKKDADIRGFIERQLKAWPMAANNVSALAGVETKELDLPGMHFRVQFNPARIVSSGAKVDAAAIKARPCFLCAKNRPAEQFGIEMDDTYTALINPFPIFPLHLTIPDNGHVLQFIGGRIKDMMEIAEGLHGFTVFYNGPRCGASAPDHMHFQAGNSDFLTIYDAVAASHLSTVATAGSARLSIADDLPMGVIVIDSDSNTSGAELFDRLLAILPVPEGDIEPMMNVLCRASFGSHTRTLVIPRRRHRPSFYGTEGSDCWLISPASVDLGGVFITPRREDFDRIDADTIGRVLGEVCLTVDETRALLAPMEADRESLPAEEPYISVGIVSGETIRVDFGSDGYICRTKDSVALGKHIFSLTPEGKILWDDREYAELEFCARESAGCFEVKDVTIGVGFHWERRETQRFYGNCRLIVSGGKLTLVNILPLELYLKSVISSEMSATASPEFLKAHAVISRSWLLAQIYKKKHTHQCACTETADERVKWYDRDDHTDFDVCADDHCQRYQGITRQTTPTVDLAVDITRGMVLLDDGGELADARFSKCCGGVFEQFEACWEPVHHHYLEAAADRPDRADYPDLTVEENAVKWIMTSPEAFCNTTDAEILGQVLNNYDQETADFYRWTTEYDAATLAELIARRSGIDFGRIKSLEPLERGTSGRIVRLRIVGEKRTMVIGKELEIRRALSESHLYSSAFVAEPSADTDADGFPRKFTLHGAGWGHGVGLCQIGAAVMGAKGFPYDEILAHYFAGANLKALYQ